jgi:hypothetical protein
MLCPGVVREIDPNRYHRRRSHVYHSKVVLLCWAAVFAAAVLAAAFKRSRTGLGEVLTGFLIAAAGVGTSMLLNNLAAALLLSLALLFSAYFTLKGIIAIFTQPNRDTRH